MKRLQAYLPNISLLASFVAAAMVAYLLMAHFQHTILQAWFSTTGQTLSATEQEQTEVASSTLYASTEEQDADVVCGCPLCCGVVN